MSSKGRNILIVDDEENIRRMLRAILELEGYSIREAIDSLEAIESIESELPDVVLLDLWMPGASGMSVLEHLSHRPSERQPYVIVLTAHGGVSDAVKAMRLGAADFLEKPTTPDQLRVRVGTALKEQHQSVAARRPSPRSRPTSHANVSYSETLVRLQRAIWHGDIHRTEHVLATCLQKAGSDPTFYNVLGIAFEAEGNTQTAKTFYQKAQSVPGGCEAASQNLQRLQEIEATGTALSDVAMGNHAQFISALCTEAYRFRSPSVSEPGEAAVSLA